MNSRKAGSSNNQKPSYHITKVQFKAGEHKISHNLSRRVYLKFKLTTMHLIKEYKNKKRYSYTTKRIEEQANFKTTLSLTLTEF